MNFYFYFLARLLNATAKPTISNTTNKANSGKRTISRYTTNDAKPIALNTQTSKGVKQHIAATIVPTMPVLSNLFFMMYFFNLTTNKPIIE